MTVKDKYASEIVSFVTKYYELPEGSIIGQCRRSKYIKARHTVMYILKLRLEMTYSEVGRFLKRDHTTVLFGVGKMLDSLEVGDYLAEDLVIILKQLEESSILRPIMQGSEKDAEPGQS